MWVKLVVACCAKCAVLAVGTVDATCPSQQGGTIASGMSVEVRHTPFFGRGNPNKLCWFSDHLEVLWSKPYTNDLLIWRLSPSQDHSKEIAGASRHCLRELEIVSPRRLTEASQPCYAQQMSDQLSRTLVTYQSH